MMRRSNQGHALTKLPLDLSHQRQRAFMKLPRLLACFLFSVAADGSVSRSLTAGPPPVTEEDGKSFWAFRPPQEPALSTVQHQEWPDSPLDHFTLAQLSQKA